MNKKLLGLVMAGVLSITSLPVASASAAEVNTQQATDKTTVSMSSINKGSYNWHPGETTGTYVNFRTGPGTNYSIICCIANKGTFVNVDSVYPAYNGWCRVLYNGRVGYISNQYVAITTLP